MSIEFLGTDLGVCLIGSIPGFNINDIEIDDKIVIDLMQPMSKWESDFKELNNISIFTSFKTDSEIIATQQLLQLGRNSGKFCVVFTYDKDFSLSKYSKIKELSHLFVVVDESYSELASFDDINPLVFALYNTFNVIDPTDAEFYMDFFYRDRFFQLKKSSQAKLVIFKINKSDYDKYGNLNLATEVKNKLKGYCSGLINTYVNWHLLDRERDAIEEAVNSVSLQMAETRHTSCGDSSLEKNEGFICIIAFDFK